MKVTEAHCLDLVSRQLEAYNRGDIAHFCDCFSENITVFQQGVTQPLFTGMKLFRERYTKVFAESPQLHAEIKHRLVLAPYVIDEEKVTGRMGVDVLRAIAIYQIGEEKIESVSFIL